MADLATTAPTRLAPNVLVEVGLADRMARIDTVIGPLHVAWNGLGVSGVESEEFAAEPRGPDRAAGLPGRRPPRPTWRARSSGGSVAIAACASTSTCEATASSSAMCWRKALDIPRGEVRPYGWVAAEIGRPKAVRAVGTALGHNPVPLIVPCHRVVRTDGHLGQYSLGGPENKRAILASEGLDPDEMEDAARRGERLIGCALDPHRVLADVPHRSPHARAQPPAVPLARGRGRRRIPAVQGLPAGERRRGGRRLSASLAPRIRPDWTRPTRPT